jgi:hypothetical protein
VSRKRTLEIDEDITFQRKEWLAQRVGVGVLFAFVLAALLGLTGMGGPLSHGVAGDSGAPVQVEYDRIVRRGSTATIKVHLRDISGEPRVWIADEYVQQVRIESIEPEPQLVSIEAGRRVYAIRTTSSPATITLEVHHRTFGKLNGEIGLIDGPSCRFSQFSLF